MGMSSSMLAPPSCLERSSMRVRLCRRRQQKQRLRKPTMSRHGSAIQTRSRTTSWRMSSSSSLERYAAGLPLRRIAKPNLCSPIHSENFAFGAAEPSSSPAAAWPCEAPSRPQLHCCHDSGCMHAGAMASVAVLLTRIPFRA